MTQYAKVIAGGILTQTDADENTLEHIVVLKTTMSEANLECAIWGVFGTPNPTLDDIRADFPTAEAVSESEGIYRIPGDSVVTGTDPDDDTVVWHRTLADIYAQDGSLALIVGGWQILCD